MNPITHFLVGWTVANADNSNTKDRIIVAVSCVIPDIDGLGIIAEKLTFNWEHPLLWWTKYHHLLCHNIGFGLIIFFTALVFSKRMFIAILSFISFHLHLLGDIIGSRGPDGEIWTVPYFLPFSDRFHISWQGQWELNAWQNIFITIALLIVMFFLAWKKEFSPLEIVSKSADQLFVQTLRSRFGKI
ncbi:MAG: metal-dependent hydrolase [Desulfobacterales bacterium]|nr:metal-dependent hydrolase [Desulfobacterales bacterium]